MSDFAGLAERVRKNPAQAVTEEVDRVPGKQTLAGPAFGPVGSELADRGPFCSHETSNPSCFLSESSRTWLIGELWGRLHDASESYQRAVADLEVERLITPDPDLSWIVSMALDVVSAHVLVSAAKGIKALATMTIDDRILDQQIAGDPATRWVRMRDRLAGIDAKSIQTNIKAVTDAGKKGIGARMKGVQNRSAAATREASIAYLRGLMDQASITFQGLREELPAKLDDAALIAVFQAMAIENHTIAVYRGVLDAKLQRFERSGVKDIGSSLDRTSRVVWATFDSGYPKELLFEDTPQDLTWTTRGGRVDATRPVSGEPHVRHGEAIADEFQQAAIARHLQVWGEPPRTIHVDDSTYLWDPIRAQKAVANVGDSRNEHELIEGMLSRASMIHRGYSLQPQLKSQEP